MTSRVQSIPMNQVEVSDRLRPVDNDYVQLLARSLDDQGLNEPIVVRPVSSGRWRLVAGAHRHAAATLLGWEEIDAAIREDLTSDDEARLVEIAENLHRRELNALDRAVFLSEWQATMYRLHPELKERGGDRKSRDFIWRKSNGKLPVWSDLSDRIGLSERSIRRSCDIAEKLSPQVITLLRGTKLANNQAALQLLAAIENPKDQLNKARQALEGHVPDKPSDDAILSRFMDKYRKLPLGLRRRARQEILEAGE